MSTTGNRSNPNETRIAGHSEERNHRAHPTTSGKPGIGERGGETHQEAREHNKHNEPGQSSHKPQKHSPAQEKY